jgi:carbon-monoxide dehydrogenase iron sulfur subunit
MAIRVDISKCTGCRRCETACAFFHTGKINPHQARIKVMNLYETGVDGPVVCRQCQERYCLSCPDKALTVGAQGQVIVRPTLCSLCGICEEACPIGAIEIFKDFVYVCDLCGGRPRCVEACTEGAIFFEAEEEGHPSLATEKKITKKMNPSQKRCSHIQKLGSDLRKKWRAARA